GRRRAKKLELKKFCQACGMHTPPKETKSRRRAGWPLGPGARPVLGASVNW
ncbi:MAG: 50S ribosomal protein L33, partial [Elusimicrobiota bacterium]